MRTAPKHRGEVPLTAYLTAAARWQAAQNPRSRFADEYAVRFGRRCPPPLLRMTRRTAGLSVLAERSSAIDSMLCRIVSAGGISCVLNLGAGFDARPYRLQFSRPLAFAEIDVATVMAEKEQLLPASECPVPLRRFACDLRQPHAVKAAIGEACARGPVLALAEGLLAYLPSAAMHRLARLLWEAAVIDAWVCDVMSVGSAAYLEAAACAVGLDGLRLYGCQDLTELARAGWECVDYQVLVTATTAGLPLRGEQAGEAAKLAASSQVVDGVLHLRRLPDAPPGRGTGHRRDWPVSPPLAR